MFIDGLYVPLVEPFYRDGSSYPRKLEAAVAHYSLTPAAGLVVLPPGGEATGLSDEETGEVLRVAGETAAPEKVLIAGVERSSLHGALRVAEQAAAAGFDALLLAPPAEWRQIIREGGRELLSLHFRALADASPLPVFLWSAGEPDGCRLEPEEVARLSEHVNIVGIFDTALDGRRLAQLTQATAGFRRDVTVTPVFAPVTRRMMAAPQASSGSGTFVSAAALGGGAALAVAPTKPTLKTRTRTVGFGIAAAGDAAGLVALLEAGLAGAMPRLATCAPQAVHEVLAAFKDGNPGLAAEKAQRLEAADGLLRELGVAGVKYACDLNGYFGGLPRLPRVPLNGADRSRVEQALAGLRN